MLVSTLFMDGRAQFGWTMYAPCPPPTAREHRLHDFRCPHAGHLLDHGRDQYHYHYFHHAGSGFELDEAAVFVWTWLVTGFILIAIMPVLAGTVTMMLFDRNFGVFLRCRRRWRSSVVPAPVLVFRSSRGLCAGATRLWHHIPGYPDLQSQTLFGYRTMVAATVLIGFLSMIVWAHHMFTSGMPYGAQMYFMVATNVDCGAHGHESLQLDTTTMFRGSLSFETPMLFAIGFVFMFTFAGCTGVMLAAAPADFQYHDTYFVVAHFHYVLVNSLTFAFISGAYYWYPKFWGRMYNERLGKWHFWLSLVSVNVLFFPSTFWAWRACRAAFPTMPSSS